MPVAICCNWDLRCRQYTPVSSDFPPVVDRHCITTYEQSWRGMSWSQRSSSPLESFQRWCFLPPTSPYQYGESELNSVQSNVALAFHASLSFWMQAWYRGNDFCSSSQCVPTIPCACVYRSVLLLHQWGSGTVGHDMHSQQRNASHDQYRSKSLHSNNHKIL